MELKLYRFSSGKESTLGILMAREPVTKVWQFLCYTLEDQYQPRKVAGETRIPAGIYQIKLRNEGALTQKYGARYPFHKGMLWLQNVPSFEWIYIHVGNRDDDTLGCILVGDGQSQNITEEGMVNTSVAAYSRIYPMITDQILKGDEVWIEIVELETGD